MKPKEGWIWKPKSGASTNSATRASKTPLRSIEVVQYMPDKQEAVDQKVHDGRKRRVERS